MEKIEVRVPATATQDASTLTAFLTTYVLKGNGHAK